MPGVGRGLVLALLSIAAVSSCGAQPQSPADGDCGTRITFNGNTFRSHNLVNPEAPTDFDVLGTGNTVGCDEKPIHRVAIHRVRGVDPTVAIAVIDPNAHGVYIREGTTPKDWPALVKTPTVTSR